ncbi:hypothetical protein NDU88_008632 [Pleurodeles waltl]|uniref:Uncharacterized protein n=1 Tax=Pleurodeles waltl TaxID=8319 RepID=A0AAV7PUW1_PLEWA|nr:hypothetical protein NDU88_008632 [Pleurodeles waltl]
MRSQLATRISKVSAGTAERGKPRRARRQLARQRKPPGALSTMLAAPQFSPRRPECQPAPQGLRGIQRLTSPLETPSPGLQHSSPAGSATQHAARSTGQLHRRSRNQASHLRSNPKGASTAYGPTPHPRASKPPGQAMGATSHMLRGVPHLSSPPPPQLLKTLPAQVKGHMAQKAQPWPGRIVRAPPSFLCLRSPEMGFWNARTHQLSARSKGSALPARGCHRITEGFHRGGSALEARPISHLP